MNKCRISRPFLTEVRKAIRTKARDGKAAKFAKKWNLKLTDGKLFHQKRQLVPKEDVEKILKKEASQNGMPLSRDGAYRYLRTKYVGFKLKAIADWLKRVESLQLIHRRKNPEPRARNRRPKEGVTNWRMASKNEGRFSLGVDLFEFPAEWTSNKFCFVAVLKRNGFVWAEPMNNKTSQKAKTKLLNTFADCKKRFGRIPTGVTSDQGGEFRGEVTKMLKSKRIKQRFEKKLCAFVENKMSQVFRQFAVMRKIHGFKKSLELAVAKVNNTVSRITGKAAVDWKPADFFTVKRKQRKLRARVKHRPHAKYPVGQRVRHLLKAAFDKEKMYKSYEGMRKESKWQWSRRIYTIEKRRLRPGFEHRYKLSNNEWYDGSELQPIADGPLVKLEAPPPPKAAASKRAKVALPVADPPLRRSSRARRKPVRYGFP